jgi:hypothetical protein
MDFKSQGGQYMGQEAWGIKPLEHQVQGARSQGVRMLGKGQGCKYPGDCNSSLEQSWRKSLRVLAENKDQHSSVIQGDLS